MSIQKLSVNHDNQHLSSVHAQVFARKNLNVKLYRKILVFVTPPPLPIEHQLKKLSALSLDEDNNWRLEIWRQLEKLPASPKRDAFQQLLRLDDF